MTLAAEALRYLRAGISVIPIDHRTKRPRGEWKEYQARLAEEREIRAWFGPGVKALAAVCGKVSGGLLVLDFDVEGFYEEWAREAGELAAGLPVQRTGGGGFQVFMRCPDPGGNRKLAWAPKEDEATGREVAIETRGEGGYVVVPPSLHPSGGTYRWEKNAGDELIIPEVSQARAYALIGAAEKINRSPYTRQELEAQEARQRAAAERKRGHEDVSVIDAYNSRNTIEETLERYGYRRGYGGRFIRPGGSSPSVQVSNGRSFHHSSNDPLSGSHLVDPFEVFVRFEHNGDLKAAVKAAAGLLGLTRSGGREKKSSDGENGAPPPADDQAEGNGDGDDGYAERFHLTDTGNARRLERRWGHLLRYNKIPYGRWFWWTGRFWRVDETNKIFEYVDHVVSDLYKEASEVPADNAQWRKAIGNSARKLESMSAQKALVAKAETLQRLVVAPDDLDNHPYLFNCSNVTLDLEYGPQPREHKQEDYLTRTAAVTYDSAAKCPNWLRFLEEIFDGDQDVIQFVQRAVGYSLTGDISEQCLFFAYGTGKNGKSVFFNTIELLFGDYFYKAPAEMILQQKNYSSIPSDVAQMKGKRFVVSSELEENRRLAEAKVKNLTGGDTIEARPMYKEWFTFKPTHKLWMFGNHKPLITGTDEGIWRRIRTIPFTVTIPEERRRPMRELLATFTAELSGILNWALEGYERYCEAGFNDPERMSRMATDYRTEMDIIGQFIEECCERVATLDVRAKELWQAYHGWCDDQGQHAMTAQRLNAQLRERGFEVNKGHEGKTFVRGLSLKPPVVG